MRVIRFAATFLLFLAFESQLTQPHQAYARCCGCTCMLSCTCNGYYDAQERKVCHYCGRSIEPIQQTKALMDKDSEQLPSVGSIPVTAVQTDLIQRLTELRMGQPCQRDKVALGLLGKTRDALKFELVSFHGNYMTIQTVAFEIESNQGG